MEKIKLEKKKNQKKRNWGKGQKKKVERIKNK